MRQAGIKPKLVLFRTDALVTARAGESHADFAIYATYRLMHGRFVGALKVVRKTDSRLLFPFDGAPTIGPFDDKEEALRAAVALGDEIVDADIANPEL
jgi:hypothetical protein